MLAYAQTAGAQLPSPLPPSFVQGDVTKFEDSKKIVEETLDRWKRLDAIVINAGLTELKPLKELVCVNPTHKRNSTQS